MWGLTGEKCHAVTEDITTNQASNQPDLIPALPLESSDSQTEISVLIIDAEVVQNPAPETLLPQEIIPANNTIPEIASTSPSLKDLEVNATIQDFWEVNYHLTPAVAENFDPALKLPPPQPATPVPSLSENFSHVPSFLDSVSLLEVKPPLQDFWEFNRNSLTAAPENFNPGLTLPPPTPPEPLEPIEPEIPKEPFSFPLEIESLTTNFRRDSDNFNQLNQFVEPTAYFRLPNGDRLSLQTGYNIFQQENVEDINNVPLRMGWQREMNGTTVNTVVGLDWFNRLSTTPYLYGRAESAIFSEVSPTGELESLLAISGEVEYSPYKFNARTLDNEITALRFGPNVFWQIDSQTSFFTTARYGSYSDGNQELLSFSRLERKVGSFFLAANLFTWNYEDDVEQESGYFSPPDFLVYTGEIGWQEELADFLRCRVAATLGQQRLKGEWDLANSYQALCTTQISRSIALDLGYTFSNVQNRETEASVYSNHSIQGQLRIQF